MMKWKKLWQLDPNMRSWDPFGSLKWRYLGWAWTSDSMADGFNYTCGLNNPAPFRLFEKSPSKSLWDSAWLPGKPTYDGKRGWFHIWQPSPDRSTGNFLGYFYIGVGTARRINLPGPPGCQITEVFTRSGHRV